MPEYKSSVSRLARLFKRGRNNWKEKALEKQKKVRALEIKVRDLANSRENWKARALAAESELKKHYSTGDSAEKKQKVEPKKPT